MAKNRILAALLLGSAWTPAAIFAGDLPNDPHVVAGHVVVSSPAPDQMQLDQSTRYGIVEWDGFNIGTGFGVQVNNGTGATLNRVTGGDMSNILGHLSATGSVYVINPNGIVIGSDGVVDTGGRFIASTLDIQNDDFLNGGDNTFAGNSAAYVVNMGQVSSLGGDVALMGRMVINQGSLSAPNGTVGVIAGREILMRDASVDDGMFAVKVGGGDTSATDKGQIRAAAAELRAKGGNVYALAGNTDGVIEATGVAKVKGRVFLTAGDGGKVKVTKTVTASDADGTGGQIAVNGGKVNLSGQLDASATGSGKDGGVVQVLGSGSTDFSGTILAQGGTGGFVEVSGASLAYTGHVDTGGGTLLIDPHDIEITSFGSSTFTSFIDAGVLTSELDIQDVIVETSGPEGDAGNILVTGFVGWDSAFSLSLLAQGNIDVHRTVTNAGSGDINLVAGWDGATGKTAFDASPFDAADLASQTLFGQVTSGSANGDVTIGDANGFGGVSVGSQHGSTRAYANNLSLIGSNNVESFFPFAELGYNYSSFSSSGNVNGAITVRARGDVNLQAGTARGSAAQIGHVGLDGSSFGLVALAPFTASGAISVEAGGDVSLTTQAEGSQAYAMIGHGSRDFTGSATLGNRRGDISVVAAGNIGIESTFLNDAWIGHTTTSGTVSAANITLDGGSFSNDVGANQIDLNMLATDEISGDVSVRTRSAGLTLTGSTELISCECFAVDADGNLTVQASGDLTLGSDFRYSNSGLGNLTLVSGGTVNNLAGVDAIGDMTGRWLIYADRPKAGGNTLGVLAADFVTYGESFGPAAARPRAAALPAGNGLAFAVTPVVTVRDAGMTYGGTFTAPKVVVKVNGVNVNAATYGLSVGTAHVDNTQVTFSGSGLINAGTYASGITTDVTTTATGLTGFTITPGTLTVDPAVLTVTLGDFSKTYDGLANFGGTVSYSGFQGSDDETLITTGPSFAFVGGDGSGKNAGSYTVSASGAAESSGNYTFDQTDTAALTIDRATLSAAIIGTPTKVFDGSTAATLTAGDFQVVGFVTGEGASVTQTAGQYGDAAAGEQTVTASLSPSDFTAHSGTLLSNYVLPTTASGTGRINTAPPPVPPVLTRTLVDFPTTPLGEPTGPADTLQTIDTETTKAIMDEINAGVAFCKEFVGPEYMVDCLSDRLQATADGLSATGEYSEVRAALEDASRKLHEIAVRNASDILAQQVARSTRGVNRSSSRPLTPVGGDAIAAANAEAMAVIGDTQLVLLRSAQNSERRRVAFESVSEVVGSTKVLLRSSG